MTAPASSPRQRFNAEAGRPTDQIDLARAALFVAAEESSGVCVDRGIGLLDLYANEVRASLAGETAPLIVLDELTRYLFERKRLRGNREAYYDPRNSFLNEVLDRGVGIPLTLGIILLETGWRLDLPLEGVAFPGHFLVRFAGESMRILVDPYYGGSRHFEDEAQALLNRTYGGAIAMDPRYLRTADKRDILIRMLNNLKSIYWRVENHRKAIGVSERILALDPAAVGEMRDLGVCLARLGRWDEASQRLRAYLKAVPNCPDENRVREMLAKVEKRGRAGDS